MEEGGPTDSGGVWDLSTMREDDFEQHVVYIVPDLPTEPGCPNRAESSLPRNLVLKPSQALSDVSTTDLGRGEIPQCINGRTIIRFRTSLKKITFMISGLSVPP
jgi:hypothetical protein